LPFVDSGASLIYTFGFGIPDEGVFKSTGRLYPAVTGFFTGIFVDISLSDQLNLPGEDFSGWNFGLLFTWPFFFNI
jgi:hypothetical protein